MLDQLYGPCGPGRLEFVPKSMSMLQPHETRCSVGRGRSDQHCRGTISALPDTREGELAIAPKNLDLAFWRRDRNLRRWSSSRFHHSMPDPSAGSDITRSKTRRALNSP